MLKTMSCRGRVNFKTLRSFVENFFHTIIGILSGKGLFIPVNVVLGRELPLVNLEKSTAVRQLVDGKSQLLQ